MRKLIARAVAAATLLVLMLTQSQAGGPPPEGKGYLPKPPVNVGDYDYGRAVLKYAMDHKGQRIGRGECTDLVDAALAHAKAKAMDVRDATPAQITLGYPEKIYVWGTPVLGFRGARAPYLPGDIIQFENCTFKKPDGSSWWTMPHHTAIVKSAKGTLVTLVHQNAPVGGAVTELTLDLAWVQKNDDGKKPLMMHYRPAAPK